jgi:hypothetical protein
VKPSTKLKASFFKDSVDNDGRNKYSRDHLDSCCFINDSLKYSKEFINKLCKEKGYCGILEFKDSILILKGMGVEEFPQLLSFNEDYYFSFSGDRYNFFSKLKKLTYTSLSFYLRVETKKEESIVFEESKTLHLNELFFLGDETFVDLKGNTYFGASYNTSEADSLETFIKVGQNNEKMLGLEVFYIQKTNKSLLNMPVLTLEE